MNLLHLALIVVVVLGAAYFLSATRRIDFFTVGFFSCLIYFLPGLVGYTLSPVTASSPIKLPMPLAPETYVVMIIVTSTVIVGAVGFDRSRLAGRSLGINLECGGGVCWTAVALAVLGLLLAFVETGGQLFSLEKTEAMQLLSRGHLLMEMGASMAVVLSVAHARRTPLVLALLILAIDLWIGFRYAMALALIAALLLWFSRRKSARLGSLPARYFVVAVLVGIFVISYQNLKAPLRTGDWAEIGRRLADPLWYGRGVLTSEPFTTQTVLNEVVRRDFVTTPEHVYSALEHLVIFSPQLGAETVRFNQLYQPALFPAVDHGLANNIWAQFWSVGGLAGVLGMALLYVAGLAIGSLAFSVRDATVRAGAALFFCYWAFYIHRNELLVQIGLQKQVMLVWAALLILTMLFERVLRLEREAGSRA